MLTSLSLTNFKSWREIRQMRLAPITGLFGTNSSGKTSLLQLLLMLKQTADSPDRAQVVNLGDDRSLVSLGSFRDVLHRHQAENALNWQVEWVLPRELRVPDPTRPRSALFAGKHLGFFGSIAEDAASRVAVKELRYGFAGRGFGMNREEDGKYRLFASPQEDFRFKRTPGRAWSLPDPIKCYGFPDQVRAYYQNAGFLSDFELAFEEMLGRVYYLGPLREDPRRVYSWAGAQPADMGRRGERAVDALLASRERGERIGRGNGRGRKAVTLEEIVATWLRDLGMISRLLGGPNLRRWQPVPGTGSEEQGSGVRSDY